MGQAVMDTGEPQVSRTGQFVPEKGTGMVHKLRNPPATPLRISGADDFYLQK